MLFASKQMSSTICRLTFIRTLYTESMSDYENQLEAQNEELQQKLAKAENDLIALQKKFNIYKRKRLELEPSPQQMVVIKHEVPKKSWFDILSSIIKWLAILTIPVTAYTLLTLLILDMAGCSKKPDKQPVPVEKVIGK